MATQEKIATALLQTELPSESVAGLLLELADVHSPVHMQTPPSADSVEKVLKKGWAKVATAVVSGTKEFLGERLAKHSSVQVRRLLATHSTDEGTLQSLHTWAYEKDSETLDTTMTRVSAEWLLTRVEAAIPYTTSRLRVIGARIAAEAPSAFERIYRLDDAVRSILVPAAAPAVTAGAVPGWNLTRLLEDHPQIRTNIANVVLVEYAGVVTDEIVDVLSSYPESRSVLKSNDFLRATSFERRAAVKLIGLDPFRSFKILGTDWDLELFDTFIATGSFEVISELLSQKPVYTSFSPDRITTAIRALDTAGQAASRSYSPRLAPRDVLSRVQFELDSDTLLTYLRCTDEKSAWSWLNGEYRQTPTDDEIVRLVNRPGFAFGWDRNYSSNTYEFRSANIEEIASEAANRIADLEKHPWCDTLVDAIGSSAFEALVLRASFNAAAAGYLSRRLTRELGADREMWRDAIAHLSKSALPLGKSLNAVRRLRSSRTQ